MECQKESFVGSSIPNKHISKSNKRDSEMLNLDSKCLSIGRKQAFMSYLSTNYGII